MPVVAAIDVGSNAIRLVVLRLTPSGVQQALDYKRYALRLGADVFAHGEVGNGLAAQLYQVFDDIAQQLALAKVERYRAVATAAMREARNGGALTRSLRERCGIRVEIIDGEEESRLSKNALVRSIGTPRAASTLLVDMGGGSLELERADAGRGVSVPLGTVRLLDRYPQLLEPLGADEVRRLGDAVYRELRRLAGARHRAVVAAGTGGNLDALARLLPVKRAVVPAIDLRRLPSLTSRLAAMTVTDRARHYGLRVDRAEVIVPAALILQAVVAHYGLRSFMAPGAGLRQALLDQQLPAPALEPHLEALLVNERQDPRGPAALALLARQLFESLAAVHGLWSPALGPLLAAAYLRELGESLDAALVRLLSLDRRLGLDEPARRVAAWALAASHGKRPRALSDAIGEEERRAAKLLGALLRLAVELRAHGAREAPLCDLTVEPLTLQCRLKRPLPAAALSELKRLLGRRLRVR